jgi:hypothetical protein
MTPKTDIIYNYDYAQRLYRGHDNFKDVWRNIIGWGADFEAIFAEYGDHILELVEKYSGFAWDEHADDFLPIYIVESESSFVQPFTLTVKEDPLAMLEDFVYHLAHRNMAFGFSSDDLRTRCLAWVTTQVMGDLQLREPGKQKSDIRSKTIKEYLNK